MIMTHAEKRAHELKPAIVSLAHDFQEARPLGQIEPQNA